MYKTYRVQSLLLVVLSLKGCKLQSWQLLTPTWTLLPNFNESFFFNLLFLYVADINMHYFDLLQVPEYICCIRLTNINFLYLHFCCLLTIFESLESPTEKDQNQEFCYKSNFFRMILYRIVCKQRNFINLSNLGIKYGDIKTCS